MTTALLQGAQRPLEHLRRARALYPQAWAEFERLRLEQREKVLRHGPDAADWPDWCYVPLAASMALVAADMGVSVQHLREHQSASTADAARLAALAAWRMGQGVYAFDPEVFEAVRDTPLNGAIPHQVLYRMPEWCPYIQTPGLSFGKFLPVLGFFAHLECDAISGQPSLRLLFDIEPAGQGHLLPLSLHLGPWSLAEAVARVSVRADREEGERPSEQELDEKGVQRVAQAITPFISLLLYVCTQASEITAGSRRSGQGAAPSNPEPVHTRRGGWRFFPPDAPRAWNVGVRLGAALRRAYQAEREGRVTTGHLGGTVRGHVRCSHWHTFLSGPRKRAGELVPRNERMADLRWLPPIPVALDTLDELPATVRQVA